MSDIERRARVHAALADPVRLSIVDELAMSDRSPTELAERFSVRTNLLAHHLDVLEDAGLIDRTVSHGDRRRRYVRLVPEASTGLVHPAAVRAAGVLFVCTRNSARSQLAAALWNSTGAVPAASAGTDPADRVHPAAVRAAGRRGLDLTDAVPTGLRLDALADRLVVTVCDVAHEDRAALADIAARSGLPLLHWSIPDPAASGRAGDFEAATDAIGRRVATLSPVISPN